MAILPYIEQEALYKQFKLNEPWDSEHNKKLIPKMPDLFALPGADPGAGKTHFRALAGSDAFIPLPAPWVKVADWRVHWRAQPGFPAAGRPMSSISDGTSNTLAVAEATEAVEWTKPDELVLRDELPKGGGLKDGPLPKLGGAFPGGFLALMCDGRVHFFPSDLKPETIRALITVARGEVVGGPANAIIWPPKPKGPGVPKEVPATLPDAAARTAAVANYQTVLVGMYDYHDAHNHLPAGIADLKGAVGLSWRVQILPYLGEKALFDQFRLTEAWDSEHNRPLVEKMPKVFETPGAKAPKGHTFLRTTQGAGGLVSAPGDGPPPPKVPAGQPARGRPITQILDGIVSTAILAEGREAVPWTKPDELPVSIKPGSPPPALGGAFGGGFHLVFGDLKVVFYKSDYPAADVLKLLTPAGAEVVDALDHPDKIGYAVPFPGRSGKPK